MRGPLSRQIAAIDAECDRKLAAGCPHDGYQFHADDTFLTELLGLVLGFQAGVLSGTQTIRTKGNDNLQLTQAEIVALAAAVGDYRKQVYAQTWAAKDAARAAAGEGA